MAALRQPPNLRKIICRSTLSTVRRSDKFSRNAQKSAPGWKKYGKGSTTSCPYMPFPPPPKSQDWLLDTRSRYQTLLIAKQKIVYTTGDARKLIARTTPTTFRNLTHTEMGSTKSLECGSTQLYLIQVIISLGYRIHSIVSQNCVSHCCEHAYLNK